MAAFYTYLISSLPTLKFWEKPAISLEALFAECKGLVPEKDIEILRSACYREPYSLSISLNNTLDKWIAFEVGLRNELVRARARRKKTDPEKFLRLPDQQDAYVSHIAMGAYRMTALLEAEKTLDQERWNFLEHLSTNHFFDFDFLLTYTLKLKILERWEKIKKADKDSLFNRNLPN